MDFNDAKALLDKLGLDYLLKEEWRGELGQGRAPHPLKFFKRVELGLTPEDWMNLCMSEGSAYVGGCCGNMSALQDELNHNFRMESGWISCDKLAEIVEMCRAHDGFGSFDAPTPNLLEQDFKTLNPWDKMAIIWHAIEGNWVPAKPRATHPDNDPMDTAVSLLRGSLQLISFHRLFGRGDSEPTDQTKAKRALLLAKMVPALKMVHDQVQELSFGGFEGWALIEVKKGDEAVCRNGYGPCIYDKLERLQEITDIWQRHRDEHEERKPGNFREDLAMRKVRVSWDKGVEFLGPLEQLP